MAKILVTAPPALPSPPPHSLGYRMPAEWERHQATWLTWPHCEETWPGRLETVVEPYVRMIDALRQSETVHINTLSEAHRDEVEARLAQDGIAAGPGSTVHLHVVPTDDEWIRDYGALFVVRDDDGSRAATSWLFNAWGNKYDRTQANNLVPEAMAESHHVRLFHCPIVLEGGSIDLNGQGLALTTESCLLNPNRNPGLHKSDVERWLEACLGVRETIWLGDGIAGDDTDGHVDDLARFVGPRTVVVAQEDDPGDENFAPLRDSYERLQDWRDANGVGLTVETLPMPPAVTWKGERLPASYANFLIANTVVLLPTFDHPNDERAADVLRRLLPGRTVVGIPSRELVWGLGACHCLSQHVPAALAE